MKSSSNHIDTLVSIVGAGPGDPKLLTIKAKECLQAADAIFYDALVNPIILSYCREGIERIPVGKRAGRHSHEQESINDLLVQRALKGGRIVRLKGGDPFIFGRGGEEIQALNEHQIPFEVIPGLSAGITVPTYSGIPMTHRGVSRSVTFITASSKTPAEYNLPWQALAQLNGSIAFYMGCRVIPEICQNLIGAGMSPDTPAAIISNGTLPNQRRLIATLGTFKPGYTDYAGWSPGLFVVGKVVAFSEEFDFFATTEVSQRKVLCITMDREKSSLSHLIENEVAYVHTLNMVERQPLLDASKIDVQQIISSPNLLFLTPSAVDATIQRLYEANLDTRAIKGKLISAGHTTTQKLKSYGLLTDQVFSIDTIPDAPQTANEVLLLCADEESANAWTLALQHSLWNPQKILLYQEQRKVYHADDIEFLKAIGFTHVVFSSTRAIEYFGALLKEHHLEGILDGATLLTYGSTTNRALKSLGYDSITPPEGTFWRNQDIADILLT